MAYRKDRLPVLLDDTQVSLKYSAATNPFDPVGMDSINSTSQNWPLNADISKASPLLNASIQKTDQWDIYVRPTTDLKTSIYVSRNWITENSQSKNRAVGPDEGFILSANPNDNTITQEAKGRYMPGKNAPYAENAQQNFTSYFLAEQKHIARAIPLTDIDDTGRVNPFPLLRVAAIDKVTGQTLATAEAVVGTAKDFHCRECHAKGKIAASDLTNWNQIPTAHHSSAFYAKRACRFPEPYCTQNFTPPIFYESIDSNGKPSDSLFDQEFAANRNITSLHDFYDNTGEVGRANGAPRTNGTGYTKDTPNNCGLCHSSRINGDIYDWPEAIGPGSPTPSMVSQSELMHNFHAQLQIDPKDASKILRTELGRPKRWNPADGPNPNTLFPTVDSKGIALPMEQNCLRCHGGHREPLYRDRMYTAGITCFDCHGDMLAVGGAFVKPKPGPEGKTRRIGWFEQPDCGSCHTGNANQGKDGANGFFSEGVKNRAFDDNDPTATTRIPQSQRFAVQPGNTSETGAVYENMVTDKNTQEKQVTTRLVDLKETLSMPLFRLSRDKHGNVSCAACHGGAHENWPNRDPKANDNVTAKQLQGHQGYITECNVCHTADSFKNEADIDGGQYSGDAKTGILGGPHNLHPVNDTYWWKSTDGDTVNTDGTSYGGWHNNYAKKPGKDNEDQCAACHGNDHKGTRLSKATVDRVFDFSNFNMAKLKKAGFKANIVKVAAGTPIGCDTCHSIKTSCINSPAGNQCGVTSNVVPVTVNHDPVITSVATVTDAIIGEPYSYQVTATDPDGDSLTFSLGTRPNNPADSMTIGEQGLVRTNWPVTNFHWYLEEPLSIPYTVTVQDNKGGYATQTVTTTLHCPKGQSWVFIRADFLGSCVPNSSGGVSITSQPGIKGLNSGTTYSYQVIATSDKSLPLTYSLRLDGAVPPTGISIGATNGLISWSVPAVATGTYYFGIKVSDAKGGSAYQNVSITTCKTPLIWHSDHSMCM